MFVFLNKGIELLIEGRVKSVLVILYCAGSSEVEGDAYEWYWHGYSGSVVEKGRVLKANREMYLASLFFLTALLQLVFMKRLEKQ
ncbi:hypothetical protein JMN32_01450 [Fulvivirga sp. 29W222]|uniref:Uncharacterized protein n=1 Tax=Fulvivirga marina TaxID=2494733 RepID=A0A937FT00_9BACT|nr:hypothetical protein [Fulvivirga marina]MBL6444955.1 hypothetical protein [Fulvivirga marina]